MKQAIGSAAQQEHGMWYAHRFLILRRLSQSLIILLFLLGPVFGIWIMRGNLASSTVFDTVPLSDPYVFAQLLFAGHIPEANAIIGVSIVLAFYFFVGGRAYCSWVCPINMVTDLAAWLRRKLGINAHTNIPKRLRLVILAATLLVPLVISIVVWELINPVSMINRAIVFGIGYGWLVLVAIFLLDFAVVRNGWCGHICPMGAFYGLIGKVRLTKVTAVNREQCNNCGDCYMVCPEPQVLKPPLKDAKEGVSPVINDSDCTNCGRCIDVCAPDVFKITISSN
ncbi:quinol dehydrogenase ferredoxin subunit NapH [Thalassotalea sp. M1531]|uniref:Quinol dehydrogenase ferredoxin subunit NapH n=1 Tax=Thalassotalea algicola TaxID=2716224 RepID=A0A7Y0LA22_9GAMM|nr:quinol dehydrogenase ferredoxin subunit NapH [Thalassotalea algicola]NMP30611.1 quinol dehydrogenase ferredoxin subunit NapH [Thalassotalea algicola]